MRGKVAAALLLVLVAALGGHGQTLTLRERLTAGSRLRYAVRVEHQLHLDYNQRVLPEASGEDIQRKYEVTGVLSATVVEVGADGGLRLEASFEELRLSRWYWGPDRSEAEQMLAALRRQRVSVRRDAAGNVSLAPVQPIRLERFRQDVRSLEALAALPLLEFTSVPLAPGARVSREIPRERYRYGGEPASAALTQAYEYVGDRIVADRACALLAVETAMPLETLELPGQPQAAELASPGTSARASGEARSLKLVLVEPVQGLLLAARERTSVFFRLTGRNELSQLQAKIPVPLVTLQFTGVREARWLGTGAEPLVTAVGALPALDTLLGERSGGARARQEPSLGQIARELRGERKTDAPTSPPRAAERARPPDERELMRFQLSQPLEISNLRVRFDRSRSVDGNGSVLILADEPIVVPLYTVESPPVQNAQLIYQAWLRTEYVTGQAYLEMWCVFDGLGEYYSRGVAQGLTGSHGWVRVETPFYLGRGQTPSRVQLNLVVNGRGRVWIDDIRLLARPPR